jgi:hypothetical protein
MTDFDFTPEAREILTDLADIYDLSEAADIIETTPEDYTDINPSYYEAVNGDFTVCVPLLIRLVENVGNNIYLLDNGNILIIEW